MTSEKKLFPGMTQEKIDNAEKAAKIKAAQKAMAEEAKRKEQQKKKAHNKYSFSLAEKILGGGVLATVETLKNQLSLNVATFLIGTVGWWFASQPRNDALFRDDYKFGEVHELPAWDQRPYKQAFIEAYNPVRDGKLDPHFWWYVNMALILSITIYSIAQADKRLKQAIDRSDKSVDLMLEIERLAKEHKLDSTMAKKIVTVAPDIVKHMSEDSRVYFDMIMDGKASANDENFLNIATAIMVGHLKTHPEDMELVMSTFDKRSIPEEVMAMYNKQQNSKR